MANHKQSLFIVKCLSLSVLCVHHGPAQLVLDEYLASTLCIKSVSLFMDLCELAADVDECRVVKGEIVISTRQNTHGSSGAAAEMASWTLSEMDHECYERPKLTCKTFQLLYRKILSYLSSLKTLTVVISYSCKDQKRA